MGCWLGLNITSQLRTQVRSEMLSMCTYVYVYVADARHKIKDVA